MQTEKQVQNAIVEALVWDGWLVIRPNQGLAQYDDGFDAKTGKIKKRSVSFAVWQALGIDQQDSGMSDVIVMKHCWLYNDENDEPVEGLSLLAIECKAPGKGDKLNYAIRGVGREENVLFQKLDKREQNQARFLWSVHDHGGIAIVADCLEDVEPYLERAKVQ